MWAARGLRVSLERKPAALINPLLSFTGLPDEGQLGKTCAEWLSSAQLEDAPVMMSCFKMQGLMVGHGGAVLGDEGTLMLLTEEQDGGIERAQDWRAGHADAQDIDLRSVAAELAHIVQ